MRTINTRKLKFNGFIINLRRRNWIKHASYAYGAVRGDKFKHKTFIIQQRSPPPIPVYRKYFASNRNKYVKREKFCRTHNSVYIYIIVWLRLGANNNPVYIYIYIYIQYNTCLKSFSQFKLTRTINLQNIVLNGFVLFFFFSSEVRGGRS